MIQTATHTKCTGLQVQHRFISIEDHTIMLIPLHLQ